MTLTPMSSCLLNKNINTESNQTALAMVVRILVCEINHRLAKARFAHRLSNDPNREKFHGDKADDALISMIETYDRINIDTPMMDIDTTDDLRSFY